MQKKDWLKDLSYQKRIEKAKIPYKKQVGIFLTINLVIITLAIISFFKLPPQIPLFYGLPEGEEQLVPSWFLALPNLIALIILLINSVLANYSKDEYSKKVIIISGFAATTFATITVLKIFFLVGNI